MTLKQWLAFVLAWLRKVLEFTWEDTPTGYEVNLLPNPKRYLRIRPKIFKLPSKAGSIANGIDIDCGRGA